MNLESSESHARQRARRSSRRLIHSLLFLRRRVRIVQSCAQFDVENIWSQKSISEIFEYEHLESIQMVVNNDSVR